MSAAAARICHGRWAIGVHSLNRRLKLFRQHGRPSERRSGRFAAPWARWRRLEQEHDLMSVGRVLVLCMAIISALASVLAARTVFDAWSNYATSSEGIATTQSLAAALRTVERLGIERAPAQPLLVADSPAEGAALKPLLDARAAVDQGIAELRSAAASLAGSPANIVGPSSEFSTALIAVRKSVNAAVALPKDKRDPKIGVDMLVKLGALQKSLTPLIDSLQGDAARASYKAG